MSKVSAIAKNYAKALFQAAKSAGNVDKVKKDFEIIAQNFNKEIVAELKNPAISKQDLVKIISEICEKLNIGQDLANFLKIVAQNKRIGFLHQISAEFSNLVKLESGVVKATIISASELESSKVAKIKDLIAKKYQAKEVELNQVIKRDILGGIQVKVGSELIDASLKNQLKALENRLVEAI